MISTWLLFGKEPNLAWKSRFWETTNGGRWEDNLEAYLDFKYFVSQNHHV